MFLYAVVSCVVLVGAQATKVGAIYCRHGPLSPPFTSNVITQPKRNTTRHKWGVGGLFWMQNSGLCFSSGPNQIFFPSASIHPSISYFFYSQNIKIHLAGLKLWWFPTDSQSFIVFFKLTSLVKPPLHSLAVLLFVLFWITGWASKDVFKYNLFTLCVRQIHDKLWLLKMWHKCINQCQHGAMAYRNCGEIKYFPLLEYVYGGRFIDIICIMG